MVDIFVEQVSERLIYTLDFIFKERDVPYKIINDFHLFNKSTNIKFNYSPKEVGCKVNIFPSTFLYEEELRDIEVDLSIFEDVECLSFDKVVDPLASIFYILSRYEEYVSTKEDLHGRFLAKYSIQSDFNWLERVVCDVWSEKIIKYIEMQSRQKIIFNIGEVRIMPTFDIDNTFAYKWKKGIRKYLSIAKDKFKRDESRLQERKEVLAGKVEDPYDTFDFIESITKKGFKVHVFWLLGDYSKYDKNISYLDLRHRRLINEVSINSIVGIHPSYKSNSFRKTIKEERGRLSEILERTINRTRQHFLRFSIPKTYPVLNDLGFKHEFSMGFPDKVGFRSGTARPHFWFDLSRNKITNMMIHPFAYMDGTLNEYLKLTPEESKVKIQQLYHEVRRYGGDFVFIWHNETIGDYGKWKNWRDVLEFTLKLN